MQALPSIKEDYLKTQTKIGGNKHAVIYCCHRNCIFTRSDYGL